MAEKVTINGVDYDASNVPPWYDHFVPGNLDDPKALDESRENYLRNVSGNDVENAIIWAIAGLFVLALILFIVAL